MHLVRNARAVPPGLLELIDVSDSTLIRTALDPRRSIVVEACAGSGKTWLLVSRILRLLLAGCAPGEILAITYTRKAAREIEERLRGWLHDLVLATDEQAIAFLCQRGVDEAAAEAALPRARGLYERVLTASPRLSVNTFHGWFAGLLGAAPLASGLAGLTLVESDARVREEAWQLFAQQCGRRPDSVETRALLWLFETVGADNTRKLLLNFVERRAEWHALIADEGDDSNGVKRALAALREELGVTDVPRAIDDFFAVTGLAADLDEYAALLERNTVSDAKRAASLRAGRELPDADDAFDALCNVVLTQEGTPRKRETNAAQAKRLGVNGEARLLELHVLLGDRLVRALAQHREEHVYEFNRHALSAGAALLTSFERYKRERRIMDFADLEWHVDRLLRDEASAAFLQARLDARYRHILLDEFQDTNPLQWRILLSWLGAYAPDMEKPKIFVVGDPKQSIYRFRRAEPRIFAAAADYLQTDFGAVVLANNTTRRNAPQIIEVVNRVFGGEALFEPFGAHVAHQMQLPGRVELLPLCEHAAVDEIEASGALRNPFEEAAVLIEDLRRRDEARLLAARLTQIVGRWQVQDAGDVGGLRPAMWDDVLILTRRRGVLPEFERALRAAGIPYLSVSRGGLLRTLEATDLQALLRFLATPSANLALAHALRSPLFGADDDDLLHLAAAEDGDWWQRLRRSAAAGTASPALQCAARLLESWLDDAAQLPVHDLLDRIYGEAEAIERYRAGVPAPAWSGVRANLEAFIALALELDAGRFPSLPRFVDELVRLGRTEDDEAPDEGATGFDHGGDGRVRIMTIHGAKGLEAPIVWLIDAHNTHRVAESYGVLLDWPAAAMQPRHFSLFTTKGGRGGRRRALFEAEERMAEREELNLLYVALTRAKQCFFASGIVPVRNSSRLSAHDRIGTAMAALGSTDRTYGQPMATGAADRIKAASPRVPVLPVAAALPIDPVGPVGMRRAVSTAGAEYGVMLHALLERFSQPAATAATMAVPPPPGTSATQWAQLCAMAQAILVAPDLQRFFDPRCYRRALNEIDFALPDGTVGRIDRLVETDAEFWVLDYKSHAGSKADAETLGAYRAQLEAYCAAVAQMSSGKPVRCALIFGDARCMEL